MSTSSLIVLSVLLVVAFCGTALGFSSTPIHGLSSISRTCITPASGHASSIFRPSFANAETASGPVLSLRGDKGKGKEVKKPKQDKKPKEAAEPAPAASGKKPAAPQAKKGGKK
mmetsp:Transcript_31408/g.74075  ORF Transcript_31408/g.74075 Transcript_31408/m.74075 type:complete len:114 (+) Transcript_31408:112-453(+)